MSIYHHFFHFDRFILKHLYQTFQRYFEKCWRIWYVALFSRIQLNIIFFPFYSSRSENSKIILQKRRRILKLITFSTFYEISARIFYPYNLCRVIVVSVCYILMHKFLILFVSNAIMFLTHCRSHSAFCFLSILRFKNLF